MPDFHKTLPRLTANENQTKAGSWIQNINSTTELHSWPISFKLEIFRTKLEGPTRNWYLGRHFAD